MSQQGRNPEIETQMDETDELQSTRLDRLPPEMTRFIFRRLSTEDLLQASATTERLYRVAQHHMYLSDGALMVRGGQDTTATVTGMFDVRKVSSLYLLDVYDFDRDVSRKLLCRGRDRLEDDDAKDDDSKDDDGAEDDDSCNTNDDDVDQTTKFEVLHIGYAKHIKYTDLSPDSVRGLLYGVRAKRVCFSNVLMTGEDVVDVVSALVEAGRCDEEQPPVLRCSYDRAEDADVLALLDYVECTCAGLLAEFRVTVRRPAPRAYAVYPMSHSAAVPVEDFNYFSDDDEDDGYVDGDGDGDYVGADTEAIEAAEAAEAMAVIPMELPEDLLVFTAADCSGLKPAAYKRLGTACRQLRRVCLKAARQADDEGFEALAGMPSLQHLDIDGLSNVTSDGLLFGFRRANGLQSLGLRDCPYVTDDVLHRLGELRRLRRLRLDLTDSDKTTAAGVADMLSGCQRVQDLDLTLPLNADYVDAVARAAALEQLRTFRLTFERLSFQDHMDNQPADGGWPESLAARFRGRVDFRVAQTFTKIAVSVD